MSFLPKFIKPYLIFNGTIFIFFLDVSQLVKKYLLNGIQTLITAFQINISVKQLLLSSCFTQILYYTTLHQFGCKRTDWPAARITHSFPPSSGTGKSSFLSIELDTRLKQVSKINSIPTTKFKIRAIAPNCNVRL